MAVLCNDAGPFDFRNPCIRSSWGALLPASVVLMFVLIAIPVPKPFRRAINFVKKPFQTFLPLQEAEALDAVPRGGDTVEGDEDSARFVSYPVPLWRSVVFAGVGLLESLSWLSVGSFVLFSNNMNIWQGIRPCLVSLSWLYTTIRPITHPTPTAPPDLFLIYLAHLIGGILQWGGMMFDHNVSGVPLPPTPMVVALSANLLAVFVVLAVVFGMPVGVPSRRIDPKDIGKTVTPEDYTTLYGWLTFSWVYPLVKQGRNTTLNEKDVWNLSPTMQSRNVLIKFNAVQEASLIRKIWETNSLDLILDVIGTLASVIFNYAGPFFLKRILDLIDLKEQTPESKSTAYILACLAFLCSLLKAQADAQHLWFSRRACTRIRSELMASIYDKALKRKDFSGIIDKEKQKEAADKKKADALPPADKTKAQKKEEKEKEAKGDDPKAGADVGKIVNLMASDCNRISMTASALYFVYGAPFEIIIAGTFLFQLLGWSAFAGFIVILVGWPLNSYVTKRSVRITKGLSTARDKRMSVLNELIGAVKFIKFFAWEERWIDRVLDARAVEMKWMVKSRINSIMFVFIWAIAPILVSIISFFVYVYLGNQLTVSTAFTSIALFGMIRQPLNSLPTWLVLILQTGVAVKRIAVYLDEDEVTPQVSSLKRGEERLTDESDTYLAGGEEENGLGLVNASFKWNQVEEKPAEDDKGKKPALASSSTSLLPTHSTSASASDDASVAVTVVDAEGAETPVDGEDDHRFELRDINVMFPERELTLVTGPTASGKTALLMAVLGEMTLLPGGKIIMSKDISRVDEFGYMHAISYAAQTPWLRHQSIKDNILFGYPYDEERYNEVVECCALKPDLDMLEDGDATEIGARGVSLSGGQKARVALARAVYARTRYVLLDDPLSAVDSHTSRFLYERLLQGPLLANRTVVLVTHHVELVLPGAYYLIRMLDGRIDTQGTIKDLRAQGILEEIAHDASVEVHKEELAVEEAKTQEEAAQEVVTDSTKAAEEPKKPRKLIKDEHREEGGVKWSVYKSYLKASSYRAWTFLMLMILVKELLGVSEKLWIKTWGEAYGTKAIMSGFYHFRSFSSVEHEIPMDNYLNSHQHVNHYVGAPSTHNILGFDLPSASERPLFYIGVYAVIGLSIGISTVISSAVQYAGALRASRLLFRQLLVAVVRATFRFHDTTPQGRMLNRFGKDIETIDSSLAGSLHAVNSSLASFFAAIITVAVIFPWFLVPAVFIGLAYRELAIGYLNTGRDLRRMESNTRSPIFSDFGELLEGIVTVRAFSAERRFLDGLHEKIDVTTKMWYNFWMTNRWLLLNFDALGATGVLVTTLFAITTLGGGAGLAGLCITSAMAFTMTVYWACRFWTGLELDLNSVERVVEYLDLPQEPPGVIESNRVPAYWPSSAQNDSLVTVENVTIKYAPELPSVLQNVSFTLKAGERVGLLGRTGSGKSTLAMSILRFVDPVEGRILIDGIDISTIGIHDLRSRLTFIPQDATLFSGTLRDNLDPFNEHEDSECLDVLRRVHMISSSANVSHPASGRATPSTSRPASIHLPEQTTPDSASIAATDVDLKTTISLDTAVSAGGTNFSQGQRQLIAMARALLRRSSIIVLDEATSSIDFATDAKIQTTIREEFNDSLLLTVAHRLRTVIDYDRLIVLDKGQVVEFDTPWNLIRKDDGIFRGMCLKSGSFGELEAAARTKAESIASPS